MPKTTKIRVSEDYRECGWLEPANCVEIRLEALYSVNTLDSQALSIEVWGWCKLNKFSMVIFFLTPFLRIGKAREFILTY